MALGLLDDCASKTFPKLRSVVQIKIRQIKFNELRIKKVDYSKLCGILQIGFFRN